MGPMRNWILWNILLRILFGFYFVFVLIWPVTVNGLRALRQRRDDEWLPLGKEDNELGPFSSWNVTGTYRGNWNFIEFTNASSKFQDFRKSNRNVALELITTPTKITGIHYVRGVIVFHDEEDARGAQLRVEGVYVWPFRQLRLVASSGKEGDFFMEENYLLSTPYHLIRVFSSQVFQESPRDRMRKTKQSPVYEMAKHCSIEIAARVSRLSSGKDGALFYSGNREKYDLDGLIESPSDCFSPMHINATSVNTDVYYNKAINYTLMITFLSFLEVFMLIRQMEHSNTQSGTAKVSLLMIGHQAILDAYICLLHLTAGILVESLFNAFATAAFFKFVVFSIFEMRYLLAIWKANRPANGENWGTMRRELSALYSRFYAILLGGALVMYEFHKFMRPILLVLHSFWVPQIFTNVARGSRKPLRPHYILGVTLTRAAIPLYVFGCPRNFMRIDPDRGWCVCLGVFMGLQVGLLLLQHYFGARCFVPRRVMPEKYSYYRRFLQGSNQAVDCVICMTTIDFGHRPSDSMVTPCDHYFHSCCLQRWMDIKMECPTCRRVLPPS